MQRQKEAFSLPAGYEFTDWQAVAIAVVILTWFFYALMIIETHGKNCHLPCRLQ